MRLNNKKIPYDQFVENIVIKRKIFTSGRAVYTAEYQTDRKTYSDTVTYNINEPEDVPFYDTWAREQLIKKLLIQINRGN